jgi:hypothetical protein
MITTLRARHLWRVAALALAGALLGGCAAVDTVSREPVAVINVIPTEDGVGVNVSACNADAELTALEEDANEVRVEVTANRQRGPGDGCADMVELPLGEPLGHRLVVDLTTGRELVLYGAALPLVAASPADGSALELMVESCHGLPYAVVVLEDDVQVRVRATVVNQRLPGANEPCEQQTEVLLLQPLGDRRLVDDITGEPIPITP